VVNLVAWIAQGLLAMVFAGSGVAKSIMSRERLLATGQTGAVEFPMRVVRFTAFMELLAAVGLIAPWALDIAPWLTPVAAAGLIVIMVVAAITHWRLGEPRNVVGNVVLMTLCVVVIAVRA
jgi:hypothetical protein